MKIGMVGLPQAGTTTVFNALTGAHGEVGGYGAGARVQMAVLKVPDERLEFLKELFHPKKTVHATVELEDVPGALSHLGGGEHSAQALAALRGAEAVLVVLRSFKDPAIPHLQGSVDPLRDFHTISDELLLADLSVVENRIDRIEKDLKKPSTDKKELESELDVLRHCHDALERREDISSVKMTAEQEKLLRSYAFLTIKPKLCVLNISEDQLRDLPEIPELDCLEPPPVKMCGELEMEIMELEDEQERQLFLSDAGIEELASASVVRACYEMLGLRTFFTSVSDQLRAWTVEAGDDAVTAAGKIHTDMAAGFIRAEVVNFEDLKESGAVQDARAAGKVRLEGKDYEVQDGDVITFRFNV